MLALFGLANGAAAQYSETGNVPPGLPRPSRPAGIPNVPAPQALPLPPPEPGQFFDIDGELSQFRSELRQFQSSCEDVSRNVRATDADSERVAAQQRQELLNLMTKLARKQARARQEPKVVQTMPLEPRVTEKLPIVARPAESELSLEINSDGQPGRPSADSELDIDTDAEMDDAADDATETSKPLDPNNPLATGEMVDAFSLGKVLFRNGDFVNAEKAFKKAIVAPENELTLKYLTATCLRRQKRWRRATEMYQVVASSDKDPILQKLAKWQIENIRWQQESELHLKQLREQRQNQPVIKKNAARDSATVEQ